MNTQFRITDPSEIEARGKCFDKCDEQFPVFREDDGWFSCYNSCYDSEEEITLKDNREIMTE